MVVPFVLPAESSWVFAPQYFSEVPGRTLEEVGIVLVFQQFFRAGSTLPDQCLERVEAVDAEIPFYPGTELRYPTGEFIVARGQPSGQCFRVGSFAAYASFGLLAALPRL